jgi:2-dehydro-3-deoxygalactonokinase
MSTASTDTLLGVDWGTTNRRAYLVDGAGTELAFHQDDRGMLAERGRFGDSLAELRARMGIEAGVPVVLSGMIGSAQGWQEVPYLDHAVALDELVHHLAPVRDQAQGQGCFIVPGYCRKDDEVDVMRGEETQLLGAMALGHHGWIVLPGTHSKWVLLEQGRMKHWKTHMTGELFAMLAREGTLSALLQGGDDQDDAAFDAGVELAIRRLPFTHALFTVRARVVAGVMPARAARSFVSGLLIGSEFAGMQDGTAGCTEIGLIASDVLVPRYVRVAGRFGIHATVIDPHQAYRAALARFAASGELHAR